MIKKVATKRNVKDF